MCLEEEQKKKKKRAREEDLRAREEEVIAREKEVIARDEVERARQEGAKAKKKKTRAREEEVANTNMGSPRIQSPRASPLHEAVPVVHGGVNGNSDNFDVRQVLEAQQQQQLQMQQQQQLQMQQQRQAPMKGDLLGGCIVCSKTFQSKQSLQKHVAKKHPSNREAMCSADTCHVAVKGICPLCKNSMLAKNIKRYIYI